MHGIHVTCELDLACCSGLQWLMCLTFVVHAWWQDLHVIHVSQMQPWHHQVPLKIGTIFCFGEISLLAWVHVHASNMHIVKFKTNIAFIHGYGTTSLPLMFSWLPNYRTCHGLKTVFAWCCFFKQRIDENRLVFQVKKFISAKRQVWKFCSKDIAIF